MSGGTYRGALVNCIRAVRHVGYFTYQGWCANDQRFWPADLPDGVSMIARLSRITSIWRRPMR
jgi:hypothetical protein